MKIIQDLCKFAYIFLLTNTQRLKASMMTQKNEPENKMNEVNILLNIANIRYLQDISSSQ